ncbi:MAG: hypothetical protein QOG09_955 [Solirubrobacterales bacterium]|jgi:undecaprenyl-diphosphatase|nr:hypothetical protein [Solirubrobacterales bacterium]MDX6662853.1 hypothetical protein [Solirubrobacterales bacterium]
MDFDLFKTINGYAARHDLFEDVLRAVSMYGHYFLLGLVAVLFLARGRWQFGDGRRAAVAAVVAAALALVLAQVIAHAWDRPRPFIAHPQVAHVFLSHSNDPSFPSDHATGAFAIAVALLLRHRVGGIVALIAAALLALSRPVVGVHYPGDVIGGAALGSAVALLLWLPPLRARIDALADVAARAYDWVLAKLGLGASSAGSSPSLR